MVGSEERRVGVNQILIFNLFEGKFKISCKRTEARFNFIK